MSVRSIRLCDYTYEGVREGSLGAQQCNGVFVSDCTLCGGDRCQTHLGDAGLVAGAILRDSGKKEKLSEEDKLLGQAATIRLCTSCTHALRYTNPVSPSFQTLMMTLRDQLVETAKAVLAEMKLKETAP